MSTGKKPFLYMIIAALFLSTVNCQFASQIVGLGQASEPDQQLQPPSTEIEENLPARKPTKLPESAKTEGTEAPASSTPPAAPTNVPPTAQPPAAQASEAPAAKLDPCQQDACISDGFFALKRPIGQAGRNRIVYASRFGEYHKATNDSYHGVYFLNSTGTPVLAAADGVVVVVGDDSHANYGSRRGQYGNLVILQHDLPGLSEPVFTLYAHLSQVAVKKGDNVQVGQEIGQVGMSGSVTGSTLQFEVRLGENAYQAARNPELWLEPLPDEDGTLQGAIAGRILDSKGKLLQVPSILIEQLSGPGQPAQDQIYLKPYSQKRLAGLAPWRENFAAGDLPAGEYQISIWFNGMHQQVIEVQPGKLTLVTFHIG